jgi:hypothetical protein
MMNFGLFNVEAIASNKVYIVYGICTDFSGDPMFLFYEDGRWILEYASRFKPHC